MELDSVRELKNDLKTTVLPLLAGRLAGARRASQRRGRMRVVARKPAGAAIGIARHGERDYRLAVRLLAPALEHAPEIEIIRRRALGEVDIRYVGPVAKFAAPWYRRHARPLAIGSSVGHHRVTAGTLGGFVRWRKGGKPLLLSNNHVLANENRGRRGDPILQPGSYDGGKTPRDVVGALARAVRLTVRKPNRVDAALASIREGVGYDPAELRGLGRLAGVADAVAVAGVGTAKIGRTTGITRGTVTAFEVDDLVVEYDMGAIRFDGQIEVEGDGRAPFSRRGDSGALIVDPDRLAVALVFAGSTRGGHNGRGLTYANPIAEVCDALQVQLLY